MTFRAWQELSPTAAAREIRRRAETGLSAAQHQAVFAHLVSERDLAAAFAAAPADAPLARVPYLAKDLFDVAGLPTLAGSTFLPEVRPQPTQSSAMVKALGQAGAVLAGKTHMHEFAYGITGENPHYGDCEHPRFPGRTTGGSSSGSAAAVAAGVVPLALGSDTGGSVRVPAAFCGLYGFRLTPRDAWIRDAVPLATSYDTAGWFTANAADLRTAIQALVGLERPDRAPRGCYLEMPGLDADVAAACRAAALAFSSPAEPAVRDSLRHGFSRSADTYNTVVSLEAWEYHRAWAERYRDRYSPAVWQRLIRAHSVTPEMRSAAATHTTALHALWAEYFRTHDFLVLAASPTPAFTRDQFTLENRMRVLGLTAPASIGGLPVVTLPVSLPSGLTTGLQIVVPQVTSPVVNWILSREP
jgi:amidase/aspartyl-tRNA(Asn)/glutamyl-tRNA(Gln) amidotransferase subunit A